MNESERSEYLRNMQEAMRSMTEKGIAEMQLRAVNGMQNNQDSMRGCALMLNSLLTSESAREELKGSNAAITGAEVDNCATGGEMTPEQRIDAALDSVLKASGSALRHYTMPKSLADMREVMSDAYIKGSNDAIEGIVIPRVD